MPLGVFARGSDVPGDRYNLALSRQEPSVFEPVVYDVEPTQEGVRKRPQQTTVDLPAQQSGNYCADAADDATTTAPTSSVVSVFSHQSPCPVSVFARYELRQLTSPVSQRFVDDCAYGWN